MIERRVDNLLDQRHRAVMEAIGGVHERLDELNGRTRTLENRVSVLSWAYGVAAAIVTFITAKLSGNH